MKSIIFFVINDTGNEVTLIMDRNLVTNSCWITADKYKNSNTDSTNCSKVVCNDE